MGADSKIEWCDHTFNPWLGCTAVSSACDFCYAESWAKRTGSRELWQGERRRTSVQNWNLPHKWNRQAAAEGRRFSVFCASLADVFDNQVPAFWRGDLWRLIEATPNLDWLLLTKRPQNIAKMLPGPDHATRPWGDGWRNVWLGTTAENQAEADRRLPVLLSVPAAVRFVSAEPLLGPVDLRVYMPNRLWNDLPSWKQPELDWVIAGGESGPQARPMHPDWARAIRDHCAAASVPFLFKQWGEWGPCAPFEADSSARRAYRGEVQTLSFTGRRDIKLCIPTRDDDVLGPALTLERVGKRRAGRLLDGVEHNGFPVRP